MTPNRFDEPNSSVLQAKPNLHTLLQGGSYSNLRDDKFKYFDSHEMQAAFRYYYGFYSCGNAVTMLV